MRWSPKARSGKKVPEMKSDHVNSLFDAVKGLEKTSEERLRLSDAMRMIGVISSDLQILTKSVQNLEMTQASTPKQDMSILSSQVKELTELVKAKTAAKQAPDLESSESSQSASVKIAKQLEESNSIMAALRQELADLRGSRAKSFTADKLVEDGTNTKEHTKTAVQTLAKCTDSPTTVNTKPSQENLQKSLRDVMRQEIFAVHEQIENLGNLTASRHSDICGEMDKLSSSMDRILSDSGKPVDLMVSENLTLPGKESKHISASHATSAPEETGAENNSMRECTLPK